MMKAYARTSKQDREVKLLDVPIPQIGQDEVLVEVKAFGVGIHDRYFIPGDMFFPGEAQFPYVIGTEGSGIVQKSEIR